MRRFSCAFWTGFFLWTFSVYSCLAQATSQYATPKTAFGREAMVVSAHPIASRVGVEVLEKGGNAADAAVAVQFALAVVYPAAGNIGGGGFLVMRLWDGEVQVLDYREKASRHATRNMYLDDQDNPLQDDKKQGIHWVGVPGAVAGMEALYQRYGSLPWRELVLPAARIASTGFALTQLEARQLNAQRESLLKINGTYGAFFTASRWEAGDTLVLEDLSHTLLRIANHGPRDFYLGTTAQMMLAEIQRRGGIIDTWDLEHYNTAWRIPVTIQYRQYVIHSVPPPSSGGILLGQLLKMVSPYPMRAWGRYDPRTLHLITEVSRRAYADRAVHLGDPDFYDVPSSILLDPAYLRSRMTDFDMMKSTPSQDIGAGAIPAESEETTHFSIVDALGNAIAVTTTLNGAFGSGVLVRGGGFFLNNEMDDFSIKPGLPNMYGLTGGLANVIEPQKRMLSSMTPTIVEKEGSLFMVLGTPGGSTIVTSVFQVILNVVDFDMELSEAVDAPRHHHQWMPDHIRIEEPLRYDSIVGPLQKRGHRIERGAPIGRVDAIRRRQNGTLLGAADKRGDDTAMGF